MKKHVHEFRPALLLRKPTPPGRFRARMVSPRINRYSSKQITNRSKRRPDFGSRLTNFATPRRRSILSIIRETTRPGARVRGHRDIQTTIRFYCGLETMQATEEFQKLIRKQIKFEP